MHLQRIGGVYLITMGLWFALLGNITTLGLATGVLLAISVNLLFREVINRIVSPRILNHILIGLYYLPLFLWEIFKASFKLSIMALTPKPRFRPGIISLYLDLDSPAAMTMLAVMVTLTPGTLSLDLDQRKKILYIHWVHMTTQDEEKIKEYSISDMELWARRIFQR